MLALLIASAVVATDPAPAGLTAAPPVAAPASAPTPPQQQTAKPGPSIDSLLQSPPSDRAPASAQTQGPIPYGEIEGKAYDDALNGAARAARAAAGPLDGGWTLAASDGRRMYRFQFLDRGYGMSQAEGAWRDLDGGPRLQGSGFVNQISYGQGELSLRFFETGDADEVQITLKPAGTGAWEGQLLRHGSFTQVVFKRD